MNIQTKTKGTFSITRIFITFSRGCYLKTYSGFQLRVQERGAFGARRVLAALVFPQRKAARTQGAPNAPRRRAAYPFRKGCKWRIHQFYAAFGKLATPD